MIKAKKTEIPLLDLYYYFDSTKQNSIDRGDVGRKSWQYLALKDQVLALPESQFELAMRTLQNMVTHKDATAAEGAGDARKSAQQLYNTVVDKKEEPRNPDLVI